MFATFLGIGFVSLICWEGECTLVETFCGSDLKPYVWMVGRGWMSDLYQIYVKVLISLLLFGAGQIPLPLALVMCLIRGRILEAAHPQPLLHHNNDSFWTSFALPLPSSSSRFRGAASDPLESVCSMKRQHTYNLV